MTEERKPKVLLAATTWWPLSARMAMAFLRHGCEVSGVCPPEHPLRFVAGLQSPFPYNSVDSVKSLKTAIETFQPTLIVPCDDGVVWQLHQLHATHPGLRSLIERSLGKHEAFPILRSRAALLETATALGLRIPETRIVASQEDLELHYTGGPAVLKVDGTWGGSGVAIVHTLSEATSALHRLLKPMSIGVVGKRWLVNGDPLALWSWKRRKLLQVTLQRFIHGRPANCMIACHDGRVLGIVTVEVLASQGSAGAATVVRIVHNEEIERTACQLARKLELNGFHGLDFMLEENTGAAYLIELNPRCTQLGHLCLPHQSDLAGILCATLHKGPAQSPVSESDFSFPQNTIAFFPQSFDWNPQNGYLKSAYHDVPWSEPALVRELLRTAWPERRLISRIYHYFRAPKRQIEMKF